MIDISSLFFNPRMIKVWLNIHSPLADITNTQKCDPSSSFYRSKINQNLQDTDTDSDFKTDLQIKNKCGKLHLTKSNCAPTTQEVDSAMDRSVGELEVMDSENKPGPLEWDYLDPSLKALLPSEEGLTYVITELNHLPTEDFPGAPEYS